MVLSFESCTWLVVSSIFHFHPRNGTMIPTDFMLHTSCFLGVAQALVSNPTFQLKAPQWLKKALSGPISFLFPIAFFLLAKGAYWDDTGMG
jgi:hypothetical protein